ncbi:MAG: hypothetical protein IJK18_02645 [Clostridia bacterium]|nr:hypothetical protein [Clostridia bacterium]
MLNANVKTDLNEISKYGKAKGFLLSKRYKLPTFPHYYIIQSEEEVQELLDTYPDQKNFYMRSDTKIGDIPIGVNGQNGNRDTIFDFFKEVKKKSSKLGSNGVALIYWNDGAFCPTYKTEGCFYLDYRTQKQLLIDYVGKGWDGSCLSHGSACHESFAIPWQDILFLNDINYRQYRKKVVSQSEYDVLRKIRINKLVEDGITQREIAENSIPCKYCGINNTIFEQIIEKVIFPMFTATELQKNYKEYISIVQIENGKIIVPEIILPERLRIKEKSGNNEER